MKLKVYFKGAEELKQGIAYVAEDLCIEIVTEADAQITVTVGKKEACYPFCLTAKKQASLTAGAPLGYIRGLLRREHGAL